jgi:hypothetical protein
MVPSTIARLFFVLKSHRLSGHAVQAEPPMLSTPINLAMKTHANWAFFADCQNGAAFGAGGEPFPMRERSYQKDPLCSCTNI